METLIQALPKVELHLHIEGTLEPELMFSLAERNKVALAYDSPEALKKAYQFNNLQEFLNMYHISTTVLQTEQDFYDLTWAYLQTVKLQNVRHVEIFFDLQTYTMRGISIEIVINGLYQALLDAKTQLDITSELILCFLRDQSAQNAMQTLEQALAYKDKFIAVGLASAELGHPPEKFTKVFDEARKHDLLTVAHAGEEGPANYIRQALDLLKVSRIDHGVRCFDDPKLVEYLAEKQIPLTVCPLSNIKLCVFENMHAHPIKKMLNMGLCATINSDDPAYFDGYIQENYRAVTKALNLSQQNLFSLAKNGINASFCSQQRKQQLLNELDKVVKKYGSE